jgi:hypothetical protein
MFQRKPSRFRRNNGRGHSSHRNGHSQSRPRSNSFTNNQTRNNFRPTQSAEKLLEKYTNLAKEALTSGDKTLSENYFQHADHFMRVVDDKNKNRIQSKVEGKPLQDNNALSESENTKSSEDQSVEEKK